MYQISSIDSLGL